MTETPTEGTGGYPEEQPDEVDSGGGEASKERRDSGDAPDQRDKESDAGKATGNPRSAG